MKKDWIPLAYICIIVSFFLGLTIIFHILGWAGLALSLYFYIFSFALMSKEKAVKKSIIIGFSIYALLIPTGFIITSNIVNAILLGNAISMLLNFAINYIIQFFTKKHSSEDTEKEKLSEKIRETRYVDAEDESGNYGGGILVNGNFNNQRVIEEAILRMHLLNMTESIIQAFKNDLQPMIYEPPYGAAYSLDQEEDADLIEEIRRLNRQGLLVWGIISCSMYTRKRTLTVYCMLYIEESIKSEWKDERNELIEGLPHVYTICKEDPSLLDHGTICIYMSPGGTPLRQVNQGYW